MYEKTQIFIHFYYPFLYLYYICKMIDSIRTEVYNAFQIIKKGGVILYPTDTVWGIGCDATNSQAIKRIFALKKRTETKGMIILVNSDKMLYEIFDKIPKVAFQIWNIFPSPTTIILDNPKNIAPEIVTKDNSIGVRMVKEPFCYNLISQMKKPLVSTSANISNEPTPKSFSEINPEIITGMDYVVNLYRDKQTKYTSTILKITSDNQIGIIRR